MKEFKDMLGPKKAIDPVEKEAKLAAIKGMRKMAGDMMANDAKSMKKVTVAAPTEKGLELGLEKAEDLVSDEASLDEEVVEDEIAPEDELQALVDECNDPAEIDELIAKLSEKKEALQKV